jgi:hypothetical protein
MSDRLSFALRVLEKGHKSIGDRFTYPLLHHVDYLQPVADVLLKAVALVSQPDSPSFLRQLTNPREFEPLESASLAKLRESPN